MPATKPRIVSLNINNINAGFNASGLQFSRIDEILEYGIMEYVPHFEAPKGGGKHLMFANTLWLGGISQADVLHIAAERYRQYGAAAYVCYSGAV